MTIHKRLNTLSILALFAGAVFAQDPVQITPFQVFSFNAQTGQVQACAGCSVFTYAAGTNTPSPTYTNSSLMVQNTNPVLTNSAGYAAGSDGSTITGIWVGAVCLKLVTKDANAVTLWTQDNICDQPQILKALLAGITGAAQIGFEQPGGIPITVAAALNNQYFGDEFASAQVALTACPTNGTVVLSGTYMVNNLTVPSNCTVLVPPGSILKKNGNQPIFNIGAVSNVTIDGGGGGLLDGQFSQSAYATPCAEVSGGSYIKFAGLTATNCGTFGIYFNGATTLNQHTKVLNSVFTNNQDDGIYSQGLYFDWEWAGNNVDGSGNSAAFPGSHSVAVHYQQAGTAPPHAGSIHDNVMIAGPNNCIEIGSFIAPYPRTSWPYDIHLSNNTCLISSVFSSGSSGPAGDSFSDVDTFTIDNEILDAQGNPFFEGPEIIGTNGSVHGQQQRNCAAAQIGGMDLNQSASIDVSGGNFCGQIVIAISGPAGNVLDIPMPNNRFRGNNVTLQSGFVAAATAAGFALTPLWINLNDVMSSITQTGVTDNIFTGVSTSDGTVGVIMNNPACTISAKLDQTIIARNFFNLVQSGLATDGCTHTTNVSYRDNIFGSGTAQFAASAYSFGSIIADNFGYGHFSEGFTPACASGTGLDGAGGAACTANGGSVVGDYFEGSITVVASGTPATASASVPKAVFSLTVPSGVYQVPPSMMGSIPCAFTPFFAGGASLIFQPILNTMNTGFTVIQMLTTTTLASGSTYGWNYRCH